MKKAVLIIVTIAFLGIVTATVAGVDKKTNSDTTKAVATESKAQTTENSSLQTEEVKTVKDGEYTGDKAGTPYGDVQIALTVKDGKIIDVDFIAMPENDSRSRLISEQVVDQLETDTISQQSTQIDTISGATYTYDAYIDSLQSALDKSRS